MSGCSRPSSGLRTPPTTSAGGSPARCATRGPSASWRRSGAPDRAGLARARKTPRTPHGPSDKTRRESGGDADPFGGPVRPEWFRVRHDDPSRIPNPSPDRDPHPQARAHTWAWILALVALIAVTSLAVAVSVSVWLVPPYLVLMSLILIPPGRLGFAADRAGTGRGPGPIADPVTSEAEV